MDEKKPQLYLNMILKEDEPIELVKRALDSIKDFVQDSYIAVTYKDKKPSQDNELVELLDSYKINVLFFQWVQDFAKARQFVMDNTPHGADKYIYWQDADDIIQNPEALARVLEDAYKAHVAAVFFEYYYSVELDETGQIKEILIKHKRERIIRNDGTFKWIGELHETLIEQRQENITKISRDDCIVVHLTSQDRIDKSLVRNIEILEAKATAENHKDPRTLIYLGKAYYDKSFMEEEPNEKKVLTELALALLKEYLEGSGEMGDASYREGSGWPEERATAWSYISEIYKNKGQLNIAIRMLHNAIIEAPGFPNYYIDLALVYAMKKDIPKAKHWLKMATNVSMPDTTIITTPRDIKSRALEVDYNIALAEGKFEQAVKDSEMLVELVPHIKAFQDRLLTTQNLAAYSKACQSIVYLGKYLETTKEVDKLPALIESIPQEMRKEKFASEMKHIFGKSKIWESDEIAIVCGPGFEEWSPKSIQTGLGGSEEAVVYIAQEFVKLGYRVTVYANPGVETGLHQGVDYVPYYDLNVKDNFNIFIMWRNIGLVDYDFKAKFKLVWLHDVPTNPDFIQERVGKVDKIAVLSDYHKSLLRMSTITGEFIDIPAEKMLVTSNGIPHLVLNSKWKRLPHSMIYASSPDRGLIYLLRNWEEIRKKVSDVTLDIYYGFDVFDVIHGNNPSRQQWKNQLLEMMKQPGITYHGRIGHQALTKAFATHEIWAYPTDFQEISCITAMRAQSCGTIPVTTYFAALKETIKNGIMVDVDITTAEGQAKYIEELCSLLLDEKRKTEFREALKPLGQEHFSWRKVASSWNELFKQFLPPFKMIEGGVINDRNN